MGNPWQGGYGLTHEQIANLTDRQIADHYFYPRDDDGKLKPPARTPTNPFPEAPPTPENYAQAIFGIGRAMGAPYASLKDAWVKKFGDAPIPAPWNEGW